MVNLSAAASLANQEVWSPDIAIDTRGCSICMNARLREEYSHSNRVRISFHQRTAVRMHLCRTIDEVEAEVMEQ
jgi:hypothetical protein